MFPQRFATAVIIILVISLTIFVFPLWMFAVMTLLVVGKSLYEFYSHMQRRGLDLFKDTGLVLGLLITLWVYLHHADTPLQVSDEFGFFFFSALVLFLCQFTRQSASHAVATVSVTMFGLIYIAWFLSFLIKLRFLPLGPLWVGYLVLVVKSGDIGAYLVGKLAGKTKLIPRISPRKSREGALGGLLFSMAFAFVGYWYLPLPLWHLPLLGLVLGVLGQVGDLAESLMKRDCGIKDSGRILPGMGGALDLVDSLLLTAPALYHYLVWTLY
ncbi:MAG: phosphatidate cytidylyltransferase [Candidatus Omnitrophica bacterium]|nr:phosphatidate cytidylyltransferase [Candidatus Omnitrophota bacterium]